MVEENFHPFFESFVGAVPDLFDGPYKFAVAEVDHSESKCGREVREGLILCDRAEDNGVGL